MKTINCLLIFLAIFPSFSRAQDERRQIEAERVGVYTRVLNLNSEEAKRFWPVFNEYQGQQEKLRQETQELRRSTIRNFDKMSDPELEKALDNIQALEQKQLSLQIKYTQEFKKVLPIRKVILMQKAQREFQKELIHKLKDSKNGNDD